MFEMGKTYGAFDDFTIAIRQLLLPLLDGFWPILCNECAAAWRFSSVSSRYIIFFTKTVLFHFLVQWWRQRRSNLPIKE